MSGVGTDEGTEGKVTVVLNEGEAFQRFGARKNPTGEPPLISARTQANAQVPGPGHHPWPRDMISVTSLVGGSGDNLFSDSGDEVTGDFHERCQEGIGHEFASPELLAKVSVAMEAERIAKMPPRPGLWRRLRAWFVALGGVLYGLPRALRGR